jgi:hypothetical protein
VLARQSGELAKPSLPVAIEPCLGIDIITRDSSSLLTTDATAASSPTACSGEVT